MVKRGAQPGAGTFLAGSRQAALLFADRMLRNLGTPIQCFGQLMRAIFLGSSLITTTARGEFRIIESIYVATKRLMGSSRDGGRMAQKVIFAAPAQLLQKSRETTLVCLKGSSPLSEKAPFETEVKH
jgi:hypothetical protein